MELSATMEKEIAPQSVTRTVNENLEPLLTVTEALKYLRCSRGFLNGEMRSGNIKFRRFGSRIYFTDLDLKEYVDRNVVAAKAAA